MPEEVELVLKERCHEYAQVYTLSFTAQRPILFIAGQYAHFRLPELPRADLPVRELSFASAPEDNEVVITVNTRSGSAYQKGLLALLPGEKLMLFKIRGEMIAQLEEGEKVVCISHGVGAAPFCSILRHLSHRGSETAATLIQIDNDEYLYQREFASSRATHYRIKREEVDETLQTVIASNPYAQYLVAGAPPFVLDIEKKLKNAGIMNDRVKRDVFNGLEE